MIRKSLEDIQKMGFELAGFCERTCNQFCDKKFCKNCPVPKIIIGLNKKVISIKNNEIFLLRGACYYLTEYAANNSEVDSYYKSLMRAALKMIRFVLVGNKRRK